MKTREDAGFNPFREACKIIDFAEQSGRTGHDVFAVFVKDGCLQWTTDRMSRKAAGFIGTIDRVKFAAGITSKAWRKLEEKIAMEMCRQRKAW